MATIKITKATTNSMAQYNSSRVIGMTISFDESNFDYVCDKYKANEYKPMLDGEFRLFLYTDGSILLEPKNPRAKTITITEYTTIK